VLAPAGAAPQIIEVSLLRLANTVLAAYRDGVTDPDTLKDTAIRLMRHAWAENGVSTPSVNTPTAPRRRGAAASLLRSAI
jgi:hypothetical protein